MRRNLIFLCVLLMLTACGSSVPSVDGAILVMQPSGSYTTKQTLSSAATDADVAGKTVVVTSALSASFSNISSSTLHQWPADRALKVVKGGSIGNTTIFRFAPGTSVEFPTEHRVFTGAGVVTGLKQVRPEWFMTNTTPGTTDVTSGVQAALTNGGEIILLPGQIYKCNSGITMDIYTSSLKGNKSVLDFSGLTNGSAITFTNSATGDSPWLNVKNILSGIEMIGNNSAGTVIGINYEIAGSEPGVSHVSVDNMNVHAFGTGAYFGDNAYVITHYNCDFHHNGVGVKAKVAASNGGERLSFVGGTIFGNGTNVEMNNGSGDFVFTNVSIDFPTTLQFKLTNGQIALSGCHVEGGAVPLLNQSSNTFFSASDTYFLQQANTGATPFITVNGTFNVFGGRIYAPNTTLTLISGSATSDVVILGTHLQYSGPAPYTLLSSYLIKEAFSATLRSDTQNLASYHTSTSGRFLGGTTTTLAAQNTWVSLGVGTASGLFTFRDATVGGVAVFIADDTVGATSVNSSITGFEMRYNSGQMEICCTDATSYPRTVKWSLL